MKFLSIYLKNYRKLLILSLLLATVNQIFRLLDPQIFRLIIDNYASKVDQLEPEAFFRGITLLLLGFVGVALVSRLAKNFQDYYVNVITQKIGTDLYAKSVEHSFSLPFVIFEDRRSGEILQKLQKARTDTQALITGMINTLFLSAIGVVFVLIYSFWVHWSIGLVFSLTMPFLGIVIYLLSGKIKKAQTAIVKEQANLSGSTTETLRNVELVKSLGLEAQEIKRLNDVNTLILGLDLEKIKLVRTLSFIQGTLVNASRALIMLLMLWLIFSGDITLGEFFTLLFYSFFIFNPLAELGEVVTQYQEARASNEELHEILQIPPEPKPVNPKAINKIESIKFDEVSFNYSSNDSKAVDNTTLEIQAGDSVAFVGPSGSGKTTMVKLLVGLYKPVNGSLLFNQIDSKEIDYQELRKKIGLVSQETQLFAGTIKDNLLFVKPTATDEECLKALESSSAMKMIQRGSKGLNTKIGEGGLKLSGGERQRLAIARALLRQPEILIFDEATSSLDSLTEKDITETIKDIEKLHPELITITVAHRLSIIAHIEKICVLEKGKITETGTHKQLVNKKGLYAALWREQIAAQD